MSRPNGVEFKRRNGRGWLRLGRDAEVQDVFQLKEPIRWPLVSERGACAIFECSLEQLRANISLSRIVAFNIAVIDDERGGTADDPSVKEYLRVLQQDRKPVPPEIGWEKIVALIIPHDKPVIDGTEAQTLLGCESKHVINLLEAKRLKKVSGTDWGQGRGNTPSITRDSFVQFLKERIA